MPHELFTKLPTNGVLRTSQARSPPKFAYIGFSEVRIAPVRSGGTRPGQNSLDNAPPLTYPYRVSDHNNPDLRSRNDMDAVRDIARELADIAHHFSALKGEVNAYLSDPNYATLPFRLENAHAPVEAAAVRRGGGYGCTRVKSGEER